MGKDVAPGVFVSLGVLLVLLGKGYMNQAPLGPIPICRKKTLCLNLFGIVHLLSTNSLE